MTDTAWLSAACLGMDDEIFYPESQDPRAGNEARRVCARCPISGACLDFALANREPYGVWGGLDQHERDRLARRVGIPPPSIILGHQGSRGTISTAEARKRRTWGVA